MIIDPIGDCFSRIRNGLHARSEQVEIPYSKLKESIVEVLRKEGLVSSIQVNEKAKPMRSLVVRLKYDTKGEPVLEHLQRVSRPGHRIYQGSPTQGKVRSGLGFQIISTSKGVMTDREASELKIGGEVIGEAW